jgi:hypothetical protein
LGNRKFQQQLPTVGDPAPAFLLAKRAQSLTLQGNWGLTRLRESLNLRLTMH